MGFLQLDSLNVVERAHHLTVVSRSDYYRHEYLTELLEHKHVIFETRAEVSGRLTLPGR